MTAPQQLITSESSSLEMPLQINHKLEAAVSSRRTPRNILFVTPRYFPYMGGVQSHVYQVSSRLVRSGVEVTVLTTNPGDRLPARELMDGIHIQRVPAWPANRDYYLAPQIYSTIAQGSWDLVHVQSYHTFVAPLAMLAAWRSGKPYIVTFHGGGHSSRFRNAARGIQQKMLKPLLSRANKLVAISDFEIPYFSQRLRIPENQFALIPNGGDLPDISGTGPITIDDGLIVSIGRLEKYKGHHRLIAAMPEILGQCPNARLWIAGVGPYEAQLRALANELGIADRVDIHAIPLSEREKMARELSKAALVVLFSEYETHPIAVLEALALGRPVLVSDGPGLQQIAAQGLGQAISLKSTTTQIASAIVEQLGQPQQPPKVVLPTWDDCATGLLSLYQKVLSERTSCTS